MRENETAAEKRIADRLDFGPKTAKRVTWEAWEFTVVGPHQVEVTNASYGTEKDDHAYVVGVKDCDGVAVPAECECPADVHREPDCKHKVALATVGSSTVLRAAVACDSSAAASSSPAPFDDTTATDALQTDGGTVTTDKPETCQNGSPRCPGPDGDRLPCFDCYEGDR
jgi:hypothetical protein